MLDIQLRDEFKGDRLKGTTIDFSSDKPTSVLQKSAADFLGITYPSVDLLKVLENTQPGRTRPVVLLGGRGQGKSHLMAALYHALKDPSAAGKWLKEWSTRLNRPELTSLKMRSDVHVIAESLHQQRYKFLWDILFQRHPKGDYIKGKWEGMGTKKTDIPSDELLLEMFKAQPTALLLDEFQTWFDGLTNTAQYPWRNWAFNFIQILSEIADLHPDLLLLVASIRDNQSQAYQQLHRVEPVIVNFQGSQAKHDRQRLLLYRIFQNRINIPASKIAKLIEPHVKEHLRLEGVPQSHHDTRRAEFIEAWPYSTLLMGLLEDQVLVATEAQETRDLIRILVDLFKTRGETSPVITAADFLIDEKKSSVPALLSSVANPLHRTLMQKAQRNLDAVLTAVKDPAVNVPHAAEIISALWLRSLSVEKINGAEPQQLQVDVTRAQPIDDNSFAAEMALIRENSFNIHPAGNRLVFKEEENAEGKLLASARNDKLFETGQDIEQLASEIRYVIGGSEEISRAYRVVVLRKNWQSDPWTEVPENDRPDHWDNRITIIVLPEYPDNLEAALGQWLKQHVQQRRNSLRFLLPPKATGNLFFDRDLIVYARAVYLANQWKETDAAFSPLFTTYRRDQLHPKLKGMFDSFAVLDIWNFAAPDQCSFIIEKHAVTGDKIPTAIQKKLENEIFVQEDFEEVVLAHAKSSSSVAKLIAELQEPRINAKHCIPWLGEVILKEKILRLCAAGKIAINLRGLDLLQVEPSESEDECWMRIKGKLTESGKALEQTTVLLPGAAPQSGGVTAPVPTPNPQPGPTPTPPGTQLPGLFGGDKGGTGGGGITVADPKLEKHGSFHKSPINLLGDVEQWGIAPSTNLANININVSSMTGAQLIELLNKLPDGVKYQLNVEKETK